MKMKNLFTEPSDSKTTIPNLTPPCQANPPPEPLKVLKFFAKIERVT